MSNDPAAPRPSPALADLFIPERTQEIVFWTELSRGYGRLVVNWHCGTGELALGLAKNRLRVVGVDPDPEAIEVARARETSEGSSSEELLLTWLCQEPRLVSLPGPADFGVLSGDVLGTYLDADQRAGLLRNLFGHLRPGGALGLTVPLAPPSGSTSGTTSGTTGTTSISGPLRPLPKGVFVRRVSTLRYDAERCLLNGQDDLLLRLPDGEQRFQETYVRRLYTPDELFGLLRQTGFVAIGMWGGWNSCPLRQAAGFFIVRAERPMHRPIGRLPGR
jgi:SAM-dependent methyltransferase